MKVNNPCPMVVRRMKDSNGNFFCQSCAKNIVDFRGKSESEILASCDTNTCGIFDEKQVERTSYSLKYRFLFNLLMVASLVGFNVKPLNAQPQNNRPKIDKAKKESKKVRKKEKKTQFRTVGTPSF